MVFKTLDRLVDLFVINLLFVLCCIPIVTIGPSATAMHTALRKWKLAEGHTARNFFSAFRRNFRQALVLWLIFLVLAAATAANFLLVLGIAGTARLVLTALMLFCAYLLLSWMCLVFPLLSRFDNTTGQMAKNALLLVSSVPLQCLAAISVHAAPVVLALFLPETFWTVSILWVVALCSASALLCQKLFDPLFEKLEA